MDREWDQGGRVQGESQSGEAMKGLGVGLWGVPMKRSHEGLGGGARWTRGGAKGGRSKGRANGERP